jgi:hypothetical protein
MERITRTDTIPQFEAILAEVWAPTPIEIPSDLWTPVEQWRSTPLGFDLYFASFVTITDKTTLLGSDLLAEFAGRGCTFGALSRPSPGETEKVKFYLSKIAASGSSVAGKAADVLAAAARAAEKGLDLTALILDNIGWVLLVSGVIAAAIVLPKVVAQ